MTQRSSSEAVAHKNGALMFSGRRVNLIAPRIDTISATDIAVHLSRLPMYRGATWGFVGYSVAQHSTLVAAEVAREEGPLAAMYALLHHAIAAFDIIQPINPERLFAAIYGAFDLDVPNDATASAIGHAHACVEMTEKRQLLKDCAAEIAALERQGARPIRGMIKPLTADAAKVRFLDALKINAVAAGLPASAMPAMGDAW